LKTDVEIKDVKPDLCPRASARISWWIRITRQWPVDIMAAPNALSVSGKKDKESLKLAILRFPAFHIQQ
jgi:hypothetical protein